MMMIYISCHFNVIYRILSYFYTGCNNLRSFDRELVQLLDNEIKSIFLKDYVYRKGYQFFKKYFIYIYIYIYIDILTVRAVLHPLQGGRLIRLE